MQLSEVDVMFQFRLQPRLLSKTKCKKNFEVAISRVTSQVVGGFFLGGLFCSSSFNFVQLGEVVWCQLLLAGVNSSQKK